MCISDDFRKILQIDAYYQKPLVLQARADRCSEHRTLKKCLLENKVIYQYKRSIIEFNRAATEETDPEIQQQILKYKNKSILELSAYAKECAYRRISAAGTILNSETEHLRTFADDINNNYNAAIELLREVLLLETDSKAKRIIRRRIREAKKNKKSLKKLINKKIDVRPQEPIPKLSPRLVEFQFISDPTITFKVNWAKKIFEKTVESLYSRTFESSDTLLQELDLASNLLIEAIKIEQDPEKKEDYIVGLNDIAILSNTLFYSASAIEYSNDVSIAGITGL